MMQMPKWAIKISEDQYNADRANYLTSSSIKEFIKVGPAKFKVLPEREDKPCFALGRAAHCMILEGDREFDERYIVANPPINERTGKPYGTDTKKHIEWANYFDLPVVSVDEFSVIKEMMLSVWSHKEAAKLFKDGIPELTVRSDIHGVPCQIRCDWWNGNIVDLKTCFDLDEFERAIKKFGYLKSLGFYRAVIKAASGEDVKKVILVAVETAPPYRTGVWEIMPEIIESEMYDVMDCVHEYGQCLKNKHWPTGYEEIQYYGC